jgi:hypothetical protein
VDRNRHKGVAATRAKELGVRTMRLPIQEYMLALVEGSAGAATSEGAPGAVADGSAEGSGDGNDEEEQTGAIASSASTPGAAVVPKAGRVRVLTTNHVVEMLACWRETKCWATAVNKVLPQRKLAHVVPATSVAGS